MVLTRDQRSAAAAPGRVFLRGPAGTGKTTAASARLRALLDAGVPGGSILLLVPQRTLATPYLTGLEEERPPAGEWVEAVTLGGLARRMVELFWPLVASEAGFKHPTQPPSFLTLESAQYYMAALVRPLLDQGLFDSITLERNRLYSQILDNLNKAALVGFSHREIGQRLKSGWSGKPEQMRVYDDAQRCADLFREFCLEHNLLDFSLQLEVFTRFLRPSLLCREYLLGQYRHLIYENIEEDTPAAHDLLLEWMPRFESALVIYDDDAGIRSFLGADPVSALRLEQACEQSLVFTTPHTSPPDLVSLAQAVGRALERPGVEPSAPVQPGAPALVFPQIPLRYYPSMLDWTADEIARLVAAGVAPGEIAVLAPFLPDALRYALGERLERRGIPYRSHRPSRALSDEPPARCLLTWARLAHPAWELPPSPVEVAHALYQSIAGIDLVRASLLSQILYRKGTLNPFEKMVPQMRDRITYAVGAHFDLFRNWLEAWRAAPHGPLDAFFALLFDEILARPGFGFHASLDAGRAAYALVESAYKFRRAVGERGLNADLPPGLEYLRMVRDGVIAAQYLEAWQPPPEDAVFLAPAYTFLLSNRPVAHQFWLDAGSGGWAERLLQPLTHPYILSRNWQPGRLWTAADEYDANREALYRLSAGLLRRCRVQVHVGFCEMSESGYEQRGLLLRALYRVQLEARGGRRD